MIKRTNPKNDAQTFNGNFTAMPKDMPAESANIADADINATGMDYGEMNAQDAKDSGYTDADGEAVDLARGDVKGSPTGAYTDVGAGRSGVVHKGH